MSSLGIKLLAWAFDTLIILYVEICTNVGNMLNCASLAIPRR